MQFFFVKELHHLKVAHTPDVDAHLVLLLLIDRVRRLTRTQPPHDGEVPPLGCDTHQVLAAKYVGDRLKGAVPGYQEWDRSPDLRGPRRQGQWGTFSERSAQSRSRTSPRRAAL